MQALEGTVPQEKYNDKIHIVLSNKGEVISIHTQCQRRSGQASSAMTNDVRRGEIEELNQREKRKSRLKWKKSEREK
jgi:ArsR family metal-binding transcriptional regulator